MRLLNNTSLIAMAAMVALAIAIPAVSQESPESILPPGFGDPVPETPRPRSPEAPRPRLDIELPRGEGDDEPTGGRRPTDSGDIVESTDTGGSSRSAGTRTASGGDVAEENDEGDGEDEEGGEAVGRRDLPPASERSTAVVGVLMADSGDMGSASFTGFKGRFLSNVMRKIDAPIASRWSSIALRRALLSQSSTPSDVNGADWVAERAWLLLRMGEADSARMLVQAVDTDKYTQKMMQVAMQAALATGDPSGMCPIAERGEREFSEPGWPLARAMCFGLSGESAQANALIDRLRDRGKARGIDVLLAEKVVGAGANTRRAVVIEWENVKALSAWRYGLASAVGVEVPPRLLSTVGPQLNGWMARSPLTPIGARAVSAEQAAALGVFSAPALVDLYSAWFESTDPAERSGKPFEALRNAYVATSAANRIAALKALWDDPKLNDNGRYGRFILTAKAAALLNPSPELAADSDRIIASMLSAGLDKSAARWGRVAGSGNDTIKSWALLAVGAPSNVVEVSSGKISAYGSASGDNGDRKAQLLFAGLAGLGRLSTEQVNDLAEDYAVPVGRQTRWTRALSAAADRNAPATVALIAAAGLQSRNWKDVPPAHLYHVVAALRRVGLEGEARMIAAEALMRT